VTYRIPIVSAISALALALSAPAAPAQGLLDWDDDGDGAIGEEEFGEALGDSGGLDRWDGDGDGALSEDEFNSGLFDRYDSDGSGLLEEPEFGDVDRDLGAGGLFGD
jgi:hypothetical protein